MLFRAKTWKRGTPTEAQMKSAAGTRSKNAAGTEAGSAGLLVQLTFILLCHPGFLVHSFRALIRLAS